MWTKRKKPNIDQRRSVKELQKEALQMSTTTTVTTTTTHDTMKKKQYTPGVDLLIYDQQTPLTTCW